MRKTLALIVLSSLFSLLMVPLALAATVFEDDDSYADDTHCKIEGTDYTVDLSTQTFEEEKDTDGKIIKSSDQVRQDMVNLTNEKYASALADAHDALYCGIEDGNGFLLKGDCSAAGKVITEVTEAFAPETSVTAENGQTNSVVDVYKGLCCLILDENGACIDSRAIYTKDYEKCEQNAILCEKRQWIIGVSGAGIIKVYVKQIYSWGAGIAGFIAVVVIIISGVQIQVSGVSGDISQAKQRILQSIAGLVLIFLSGIILYTVNPGFFS